MKITLLIILFFVATGLIAPEAKEPVLSQVEFVKDDSNDIDVNRAEVEFSKAKQEYQISIIEYGNKKASR
jgi:flagellar basal body rod protein FlgB